MINSEILARVYLYVLYIFGGANDCTVAKKYTLAHLQ